LRCRASGARPLQAPSAATGPPRITSKTGNLSWIFLFAFFIKRAWRSSAMRTGNGVPSKLGTPLRLLVPVTSVRLIVVGC
jgi:hypothetical protein